MTVPGDAAVGAVAMLAGMGAGIYRDVGHASARCVRLDEPIQPGPAARAVYDESCAAYRELFSDAAVRCHEGD